MSSTRRVSMPAFGVAAIFLCALVLVGGACADASSSKPARLPATFFGMIPQKLPSQADLKRMKRGGVNSIRFGFNWDGIEANPGQFNWGVQDLIIERAARANVSVLPVLAGAPDWAGGRTHLPVDNTQQKSAWKNFVREAVKRYGPTGVFWNQNPSVPKRPIRRWQEGNEPNFFFFVADPSVANYASLVKITTPVIRSLDHGAKVYLAGLFAHPKNQVAGQTSHNIPAVSFLNQLYKVAGIKSLFDAAALHPYATSFTQLKPDITGMRGVMKRHGDAKSGLLISEMGWGSGHGTAFEKGVQGQVKQVNGAYSLLKRNQKAWNLLEVDWYAFDDISGSCNFCDSVGLFNLAGKPKPAWFAFVKQTGGKP